MLKDFQNGAQRVTAEELRDYYLLSTYVIVASFWIRIISIVLLLLLGFGQNELALQQKKNDYNNKFRSNLQDHISLSANKLIID